MKNNMQKTLEIQRKIEAASNSGELNNEYRQTKQKLELASRRLENAESMEEYHAISQEVQDIQNELKEVEIEIRVRPRIEKAVRSEERKKIKDTYNQEFQPYIDKYIKLDKELKKQLNNFAKATETIAKEMVAIEKFEQSFHPLKTQAIGEFRQIISLPIDKKRLEPLTSWNTGMSYGVASTTEKVIETIKRNWSGY